MSAGNPKQKIVLGERDMAVELATGTRQLPVASLPDKCIDWIEQGRRGMYNRLLQKEAPEFFSAHLPVVITQAKEGEFPFNCSNKGIGYVPRQERLSEYIDLFQETLHNTRGKPWQESMAARIEAMSQFYFDRDAVDYRAMTGLEIFARQTYQNLEQTPLAALHFTGCAPEYMSFQLNCAVEVIAEDDPRHTFVLLARTMFEYDDFHIVQPQYPFAYIFWISEVVDKTPRQVPTEKEVSVHGGMRWSPEASQAVERAPGMIQQFIREQIEQYAADKGVEEIGLQLVQEARQVLQGGEERDAIGPYGKIFAAVDGSELSSAAMDLAVRILTHAVLIPTAKLKPGTFVVTRTGWNSTPVETVYLNFNSPEKLQSNLNLVGRFVHSLEEKDRSKKERSLWHNVSHGSIVDFIKQYQGTGLDAFNNHSLCKYINDQAGKYEELTEWSVYIAQSGEAKAFLGLTAVIGLFHVKPFLTANHPPIVMTRCPTVVHPHLVSVRNDAWCKDLELIPGSACAVR